MSSMAALQPGNNASGEAREWLLPACDVCGADAFEPVARMRSARMPDFHARVAICRACGFVTVRPRPSGAIYDAANDRWFSKTFDDDAPTDPNNDKKFHKWRLMWQRIGGSLPLGRLRVLDVGAGQGWAIEFLQSVRPEIEAVAIERWPACQSYIRERLGAEIVDRDIEADWPESLAGRFDLIIFRHVLEHLKHPEAALRKLSRCLAPGGAIYLVVPNCLSIKPGSAMRTDLFRPVHLHYFSPLTLRRLVARAGLEPHTFRAESEIWGLFKPAGPGVRSEWESAYPVHRAHLRERLRQSLWTDAKAMLRMTLRRFLPKH
jgi:SAM-dependent methyltransferase